MATPEEFIETIERCPRDLRGHAEITYKRLSNPQDICPITKEPILWRDVPPKEAT